MKKILCFTALLCIINHSFAQNNSDPWPITGNVGIGTTGPATALHVKTTSNTAGFSNLTIENSGATGNEAGIAFKGGYTTASLNSGRIYSLFDGGTSYSSARTTIQSMLVGGVYDNTFTVRAGNVGIGTVSPNGKLEVVNNFAIGTGGSALTLSANGNGSSSGTTIYGAQVNASTAFGTGSTQTVYGMDINATALGTGPSPLTAVNAKTTLSRLVGSTATGYYGGKFLITGATGTSTATNVANYGLYGEVANTNAIGEVSNSYGVYGKAATVVTATAYGGYFTATGGTTNYGVYSAAGTNYFNGNVGIGVINPQNKVVVAQANSLVPAALIQDSGTGDAGLAFNVSGASFTWGIDQSDEKKFKLSNSTTLGTSDYITITNGTGNIGIGTADTKGYKFAVNGGVVANAVTVKVYPWADYVFNKDYKLPTLTEVKNYIDVNHHLPDMPSEKEVVDNGLNLGEMNKILTKKVEELTLYLIEQNKEMKELKERVLQLEKSPR